MEMEHSPRNEMNMRTTTSLLVLAVALAFAPVAIAETSTPDVATAVVRTVRFARNHPFTRGAVLSSSECAAGIAFSSNPVGAASVGLPVLLVGNLTSLWMKPGEVRPQYLPNQDLVSVLRNVRRLGQRHPFLGREIQNAAGTFCLSYGLTRAGRAHSVKPSSATPKDPKGGAGDPPPVPKCSGNACAGGGPQPPSGGGSGSGQPPSGGGSGGSGSGSRCIQDCGLGNGGVNGGQDINKPPFPGQGPKGN